MLISFKQNEFELDWLYDYSESNTVISDGRKNALEWKCVRIECFWFLGKWNDLCNNVYR